MKKSILLYFAFCFVPWMGQAQTGTIMGMVTDSLTGNPIENVSVFIPSTNFATATNQNGEYQLRQIPPGNYTVLFRHLNYFPIKKLVLVEAGKLQTLKVLATEKAKLVEEVTVEGTKPDWSWARKVLADCFLGDQTGKKCVIHNADDVHFQYDGRVLTATSPTPLVINNWYLGYRITYFLDYFKYSENKNPVSNAVQGSYYAYAGSCYFEDLSPVMPLASLVFKLNREKAFRGNLKHFLSCLYNKSLELNRYTIRKYYDGLSDLQQSEQFSSALAKITLARMDSVFSWNPKNGPTEYLYYDPYDIRPILETGLPKEAHLLIFKDYKKTSNLRDDVVYALKIENGKVDFDSNGNYWIREGSVNWVNLDNRFQIKTLLPDDYHPNRRH